MRAVLQVIQIGVAAILCAVSAASPVSAQEISWPSFQWAESNNAPVMLELKKRFESENPGAIVRNITIPPATFWDKQLIDVMSGNAPDIVTMYDPEVRAYIEAGVLEPLDDALREGGIPAKGFVPTETLAIKDGVTYAVPFQVNARALFYNGKLLKNAGVSPPRSLDEFLSAIKALRQPNTQEFGFATISRPGSAAGTYIEIMPIVAGFGGSFFKDGKPNATAPETVAALRFIKMLYDEQLIPRGMDVGAYRALFAQGRVGMYAAGSFMAAVVNSTSVPKAAKNKVVAAKLLVRMLKDDMQSTIVTLGKTYPGRVGFVAPEFLAANPWFAAFEKATLTARSYAPQGVEQYGADIVKIVAEQVEAMLFNKVPADEAAERMQTGFKTFMASKNR